MTFTEALTALAGVAVAGISAHYAYTAAPVDVGAVTLPLLIVFPYAAKSTEAFSDRAAQRFQIETANATVGVVEVVVHDLLLYAPAPSSLRNYQPPPAFLTLIEHYLAVMRANPRLSKTLYRPTQVSVVAPFVTYHQRPYVGARLIHKWVVEN